MTALVLLGAIFPAPGVRPVSGDLAGARLVLPPAFVALSPPLRLFDALCLLSTRQHAALLATVLGAFVAWRGARAGRRGGTTGPAEARAAGLLLTTVVACYAAATLAPRPMAALSDDDPDVVRVDFHSHTGASHDVPAWFGAAARRAWHAGAGFDVAYVADHRSLAGARVAARDNPTRAGDGLSVLPAIEAWYGRIHVVVLGAAAADAGFRADDHADRVLAAAAGRRRALPPVSIATIPDPLLPALTAAARDSAPYLRAVEVADGAPRGLGQADAERDAIRHRARELRLVGVASSNHHGWGRTAVAWTLVRVPGWRALPPAVLGERIEHVLRSGDTAGVRVVERTRPVAAGRGRELAVSLAATAPRLLWDAVASLSRPERAVWLAWAWSAWLGRALGQAARRRKSAAPRTAMAGHGVDPV